MTKKTPYSAFIYFLIKKEVINFTSSAVYE